MPFVVNNNCYGQDGGGPNLPGFNFFDCHDEGYKVTIKVDDHLDNNLAWDRPLPIR